jgi:hypothetical protein
MAALGLNAGLTLSDMRHMKYTHMMQLLWEWEDMHGADVEETREATSDDVRSLMNL